MSKYSSCSVSANSWVIMKKKFITFVYLFWGNWKLQVSTVWDNTPAPSSWLWWWLPSKNANLNIPRLLHLTWHPQTTTVSSRWRRSSVTLMMMLFPLWTTFWKSKTLTSTKKGSVCSVGSNCVNVGWDYVENNCARFSEISSVCLRSWTHQSSHVQHFRLEWSMLNHSAFLNMWNVCSTTNYTSFSQRLWTLDSAYTCPSRKNLHMCMLLFDCSLSFFAACLFRFNLLSLVYFLYLLLLPWFLSPNKHTIRGKTVFYCIFSLPFPCALTCNEQSHLQFECLCCVLLKDEKETDSCYLTDFPQGNICSSHQFCLPFDIADMGVLNKKNRCWWLMESIKQQEFTYVLFEDFSVCMLLLWSGRFLRKGWTKVRRITPVLIWTDLATPC